VVYCIHVGRRGDRQVGAGDQGGKEPVLVESKWSSRWEGQTWQRCHERKKTGTTKEINVDRKEQKRKERGFRNKRGTRAIRNDNLSCTLSIGVKKGEVI